MQGFPYFVNPLGLKLLRHQPRFVSWFSLGLLMILSFAIYRNFFSVTKLTIAAGKEDGDSYKFAVKFAEVVNKSQREIRITVENTDGTKQNIEKLNQNEVQLAAAQADTLLFPENVDAVKSAQVISLLFPDMYQLIVRKNLGITSTSGLKGKKIAKPPEQGGQIQSLQFLLKHYGLNNKPMIVGNDTKVTQAFCSGKVDAIFHVRALGNNSIRKLLRECGGQLVEIDQIAAMRIDNSFLEEAEIPKGVYKDQNNAPIPAQNLKTVRVWRLLLAHKDVSPEVIQEITKILYERRQELVKDIPAVANMSPPEKLQSITNTFPGTVLPTHPGAQAYYDREKPTWLEQYSGVMEVLLAIAIPLGSGFWWLTQQIERARKNKADDYIREVTALMYAEDCLRAVTAYIDAEAVNNKEQKEQIQQLIAEKAAKILAEKYQAEYARSQNWISENSLQSFERTLQKVVKVIVKMPQEASNNILTKTLAKAVEIFNERQAQLLQNQLTLLVIDRVQISRLIFRRQKLDPDSLKQNLSNTLQNSKPQYNPVQLSRSELPDFLRSETQQISKDLDDIFKRAVDALVEERISQESFQSFRVIWQIAIDSANRCS